MPLVAHLNGERIEANRLKREDWSALKSSPERGGLLMPQCGITAVPKTRGATQFFAHKNLAECTAEHRHETPQHLAMKVALADQIDAMPGWHALVEYPHPSRMWIIDVLAEADDHTQRVAFEVQLSSQTLDEYHRRSQLYFDSGALPVWLVPRQLEAGPIRFPSVATGFGKTSRIPEDPAKLMGLEGRSNWRADEESLGELVSGILIDGGGWTAGSPSNQQRALDAATRRAESARQAEIARMTALKQRMEEMNKASASPEKAFGAHTVHTEAGPLVWATLTPCWQCCEPLFLWEAKGSDPLRQYLSAPLLDVKSEVGQRRYENHPDVHRVIDQWIRETDADIPKANIENRYSQAKNGAYSAFVCPACRALAGQIFVAHIRPEHWSLISAPLLRKPNLSSPARARRTHGAPKPVTPSVAPVPRSSQVSSARWAREIRERIAQQRSDPVDAPHVPEEDVGVHPASAARPGAR